jgi:hypothetical protein
MKPGLRRSFALMLACLPLALAAQTPVDPANGEGTVEPDIKVGNLAYISGFESLFRLDLSNGATTAIGSGYGFTGGAAIADMEGLAFAPDGSLYGVADSPRPALYRLSTTSGRATLIAQFRENAQLIDNNGPLNAAIAFSCTGKLLMASRVQDRLWEVDPATASVRLIGPLSQDLGGIAALGTTIFALGVAGSEGLFDVTEASASLARLPSGLANRAIPVGSIAFQPDGRLFAVLDLYPVARPSIAELSPVTGDVLSELPLTGPQFTASSQTPVRAIAIAPPACAPLVGPGVATAIPALDPRGLLLLALLIGLSLVALRSRIASP